MININGKGWNDITVDDIETLLSEDIDENFFIEYKSDDESPEGLVKEISAFSNTYGGYVLLGVNNNKTIGWCSKWTEERILTTLYDSITPLPDFDVRKISSEGKYILIIKIEEGTIPPYITNKGKIFERVSSGSIPIKDSAKLTHLYNKKSDALKRVKNKIEIPIADIKGNGWGRLYGYFDLGFSVTCSEPTELQKNFYSRDLTPIVEELRSGDNTFSISQIGNSYVIGIGDAKDSVGNKVDLPEGINNYIEIMADGSVRCRKLLFGKEDVPEVNVVVLALLDSFFRKAFHTLLGDGLADIFIHAQKYERLTVLKQFTPCFDFVDQEKNDIARNVHESLNRHRAKFGNNLIVASDRFPKNDFQLIDRRYFDRIDVEYNNDNLIEELFASAYSNYGYIDFSHLHDR